MKARFVSLSLFILLSACSPAGALPAEIGEAEPGSAVEESSAEQRPEQSEHSAQEALVFETSSGDEISYLLYLPEAVDEFEAWPLILHLHGLDGNGCDIELVRARSLPVWAAAEDLSQFIVVSPQLAIGKVGWTV